MNQRVITALIMAPLGIALVLFAPTWFFALVTSLVVLIGMWEWTRLSGVGSRAFRSFLLAVVLLALVGIWIIRAQPVALWIIAAGMAWWFVATAWLGHFSFGAAPTRENAALKVGAGLIATLPAWLALIVLHEQPVHGHGWTLFALMLVWAADISAYLAGRRWGRRKLCPNISPNKTFAGLYGALAGAAIVAAIGAWVLDARGVEWLALIALSIVTVLASVVGDLFESLVKRQASVKDSGALFPGHGGVFDRFDSVFAAAPVFALGKALLDLAFAS